MREKRDGRIYNWSVLWVTAIAILACAGELRASVNINLLQGSHPNRPYDWVYEGIERLVALRIIDSAMVVPKPYSRRQAARHVARAIERIRSGEVPADGRKVLVEDLLDRLITELRPELTRLGVVEGKEGEKDKAIRFGGVAQAEVGTFQVGQGATRFRENRGGEYYADGTQLQAGIRGWLEFTDLIALSAQPKFITDSDVLGPDNSLNLFMRELNAKFTFHNIAIEIGRDSLWWGPGYHGTLLLSAHPFPLDMIKLGSDEPFQLPGPLNGLGSWKVSTFLAQLERDRDFPRAKIFGLRISYMPAKWLELGFTRLTQFNGRGRDQPFPQTVVDAYTSPAHTSDVEVNEQAMIDARLSIPRVPYLVPFPSGLQFYGELAGEDHWINKGQIRPVPLAPAFLVGVYIPQLFSDSTLDFRIEYADTAAAAYNAGARTSPRFWYNNATYTSGMRHRGFPLGHHMGTDARDLFIRTTRYITENLQLGLNLNLQSRGLLERVSETKRELALDGTWWYSSRLQFTWGYTFQRISNVGQVTSTNPFTEEFPGGTSTNHFLWTGLQMAF